MLRSIFKSALGGLGAQAVQFFAIPVLARLYTPTDFAIWALCFAGLLLFSSVAALRYELALLIPKSHQEASDLFWGASILVASMSVLGGGLLALPWPRRLLGIETLPPGVTTLLFGGGILIQGALLLLTNWANRKSRYGLNATAQITLALVAVGFQVAWILLGGNGAWGLLLGFIAGQGASAVLTATGLLLSGQFPAFASGSAGIAKAMRQHYRFPLFSTPRTLCGLARDRGTVVILEQHVARADLGGYAVIQRLVNFPVSLVASAVRPVVYSHMAKEGIAATEARIVAIQRLIALVATPWLAVVMVSADQLAPLLLGPQWKGAGDLLRVLVWPCYFMMFINWLDRIMDIASRQLIALWLEVGFAGASVTALWIGVAVTGSLLVGVVAQSMVLVVYALTLWAVYFKMSGIPCRLLLRTIGVASFVFSAVYAVSLCGLHVWKGESIVLVSILAGITSHIALLWHVRKTLITVRDGPQQ